MKLRLFAAADALAHRLPPGRAGRWLCDRYEAWLTNG